MSVLVLFQWERLHSQAPRPYWLAVYVLICLFETLKECTPVVFDVLCSDKIQTCAENPASPEQFLRVIWEVGFWASPQFGSKNTFFYVSYWLFNQGLNPWPLQWRCGILASGPPEKTLNNSDFCFFFFLFTCIQFLKFPPCTCITCATRKGKDTN